MAAAEADLREIIRYTRTQWGDDQVRRYVASLKQGITRLAIRQKPYTDMDALHPGLLMAHCGHHYVFLSTKRASASLDGSDTS